MENMELINETVTKAARSLTRRFPWMEEAELTQQGYLIALELQRKSVELSGGYLWTVLARSLVQHIAKLYSPVSGSKNRSKNLLSTRTCEIPERSHCATPERALWKKQVRQCLDKAVQDDSVGWAARRVLWCEEKPAEVAKAGHTSIKKVYNATARVKRALSEDDQLISLNE